MYSVPLERPLQSSQQAVPMLWLKCAWMLSCSSGCALSPDSLPVPSNSKSGAKERSSRRTDWRTTGTSATDPVPVLSETSHGSSCNEQLDFRRMLLSHPNLLTTPFTQSSSYRREGACFRHRACRARCPRRMWMPSSVDMPSIVDNCHQSEL